MAQRESCFGSVNDQNEWTYGPTFWLEVVIRRAQVTKMKSAGPHFAPGHPKSSHVLCFCVHCVYDLSSPEPMEPLKHRLVRCGVSSQTQRRHQAPCGLSSWGRFDPNSKSLSSPSLSKKSQHFLCWWCLPSYSPCSWLNMTMKPWCSHPHRTISFHWTWSRQSS